LLHLRRVSPSENHDSLFLCPGGRIKEAYSVLGGIACVAPASKSIASLECTDYE
jgi:hypothetical protein